MSKENKNEAKVIDMTATENEKRVRISGREWDEYQELKESNKNLIAERETLMGQVVAVEKELNEKQETCDRVSRYWREAEDKLKTICAVLEVVNPNEYMTGLDFIKKIAGI